MQSYVINKTMQDVYFPDSYLYDGKANKDWTVGELMTRHIATYGEYLKIYKELTFVKKSYSKYTFITISVKPSAKLKQFVKKVEWFCERKYIGNFFYVFEQRSEGEEKVFGLHCHMVASYRAMLVLSQFEKNVHTTFASYAADSAMWMYFIIDEFIEDKVNYMLGDKFDNKLGKVSKDRIWRNENSLSDFYTNNYNFFIEDGKGRPHSSSDKAESEPKKRDQSCDDGVVGDETCADQRCAGNKYHKKT